MSSSDKSGLNSGHRPKRNLKSCPLCQSECLAFVQNFCDDGFARTDLEHGVKCLNCGFSVVNASHTAEEVWNNLAIRKIMTQSTASDPTAPTAEDYRGAALSMIQDGLDYYYPWLGEDADELDKRARQLAAERAKGETDAD